MADDLVPVRREDIVMETPPEIIAPKPDKPKPVEVVNVVATPPMNNLNIPGGQQPSVSIQVGDSLREMNIRNRAFWSRRK